MLTTVAMRPETRDRLFELKRKYRLSTMDLVIQRLLDPPAESAIDLFRRYESAVRAVCREYGVKRLIAHGSRVLGTAKPASDLDLVVSLPPEKSLFDVARLGSELSSIFGVHVDIATEGPHLGRLAERIRREGAVLIG